MNLFLGNRGTKLFKLEDQNIASKFIKRGTNKENVWEHGNIGQFWKGTRGQDPTSPETLIHTLSPHSPTVILLISPENSFYGFNNEALCKPKI